MIFGKLLILQFFFICIHCQSDWTLCPFNKHECNCSKYDDKNLLSFSDAVCQSKTSAMPKFMAPKGVTYDVFTLTITGNVSYIPANYFSIFGVIHKLELVQIEKSDPASQTWNESAFDGITILHFSVKNLAGVIPPPSALLPFARRGLEGFTISDNPRSISLDNHIFQHFSGLNFLAIENTKIVRISDYAFEGLENNQLILRLINTSLTEFPASPLKNLTFLSLKLLDNKLTRVANVGHLPVNSLDLSGDPISDIENGAFTFDSCSDLNLKNTKLRSIDLVAFADLGLSSSGLKVVLNNNAFLKNLTVSDVTKASNLHSRHAGCVIEVRNTSLTNIDPKIGDTYTFRNNHSKLRLDISYNSQLECKELAWMANISCHFTMDCTRCADKNGQFLRDFLKSVPHDTACFAEENDLNCGSDTSGNKF